MSRAKTHEQFEAELAEVRPKLKALSLYRNAHAPILVFCEECGSMWISTPRVLLREPAGCKHCRGIHTSFPEAFIIAAFRYPLGEKNVRHRDTSAIGRELDIYIPSLNFAVEPGAWVFHKNRTDSDKEKRELAHEAGIRLVTVYMEYGSEKARGDEGVVLAHIAGSCTSDFLELKQLSIDLMSMAGVEDIPSTDEQWNEILNNAILFYSANRKPGYEEVIADRAPDVELLSDVKLRTQPIRARCKKCGREWITSPVKLMKGNQCPHCANNYLMTTEEYKEKVAEEHPEITVTGEYRGSGKKITARCDKGHEFERDAGYLRHRGCPICNKKRGVEKMNEARRAKREAARATGAA